MKKATLRGLGAALVAIVASLSLPAHSDPGFEHAHRLHSLDIMLMVTALRCRDGPEDFQEDYYRFSAAHREVMGRADAKLRAVFEEGTDGGNPDRALDRMGVVIANSYGGGHPWLGCGELGAITRQLALVEAEEELALAAQNLLQPDAPIEVSEPQFGHATQMPAPVQISYSQGDVLGTP